MQKKRKWRIEKFDAKLLLCSYINIRNGACLRYCLQFIFPHPSRETHSTLMAIFMSAHLSVPHLTLHREWKGIASWNLLEGKKAKDTIDPWPHLEFERSKFKVTRPINAEMDNAQYLPKGRLRNFKLGTRMEYDDWRHGHMQWPQTSKVKFIMSHPFDACLSITQ